MGGCVYADSTTHYFTHCTFVNNFALSGGGVLSSNVTFQAKLLGDFAQVLEDAGLASGTNGSVTLTAELDYAGETYVAQLPLTITANTKGATGK